MMHEFPIYVPVLRLKIGELNGVAQVRDELKNHIRPHFIIPPSKERDTSNLELFGQLDNRSEAGTTLSHFWYGRSAFLNPRFIYKEFGENSAGAWLPALFDSARGSGVNAIPVATLSDLESNRFEGLVRTIDRKAKVQIALLIKSDDLLFENLKLRIEKQLSRLDISQTYCSILLDFGGTHFGNPKDVAAIIEGGYEDLQEMGTWESIVFQGTSFPETNPADPQSKILVPRNEWIAWKQAVSLSARTPERVIFGDYAADCAKVHFGKGGVAAIRHFRYALAENWLVVRASKTGRDKARMRWVSDQIVRHPEFAGRGFSLADDYIYRTALENGGPGTATTWRQINTTHHITRVVADVSKLRGIMIDRKHFQYESSEQLSLLV